MKQKQSKTPHISRSGLVLCPSCRTHFSVKAHSLAESVCPFCNQTFASSILKSAQSKSSTSHHTIRGKSAVLLTTLGVSMTLFACDSSSSHTPKPSAVEPTVNTQKKQGASKVPSMSPSPEDIEALKKMPKAQPENTKTKRPTTIEEKRTTAKDIAELATNLMYGSPPIEEEEEDVQPANATEESE